MVDNKKAPTPKAPKNSKDSQDSDKQTYSAVGLVFFVIGISLLLPEGTRAVGLPFAIIGFTFLILSQQDTSKKRKK